MTKSNEEVARDAELKQYWLDFDTLKKHKDMDDRISIENNRAVRAAEKSEERARKAAEDSDRRAQKRIDDAEKRANRGR